jgi:hypothetical protein
MPDIILLSVSERVKEKLHKKRLTYLNVAVRGKNIVIYSEYEGRKENRCRFTQIGGGQYMLGMADHNNRWEDTPFEGTIDELMDMVLEQFGWVLSDYNIS